MRKPEDTGRRLVWRRRKVVRSAVGVDSILQSVPRHDMRVMSHEPCIGVPRLRPRFHGVAELDLQVLLAEVRIVGPNLLPGLSFGFFDAFLVTVDMVIHLWARAAHEVVVAVFADILACET